MATTKWFEVTVIKNSDQELKIMDVKGYSHFKIDGDRRLGIGSMDWNCSTVYVSAHSRTALEKELKHVFGYTFTKYVYHSIKELYYDEFGVLR